MRYWSRHGIYVVAGKRKITICYATKEEAELLNVKENDALLYDERSMSGCTWRSDPQLQKYHNTEDL